MGFLDSDEKGKRGRKERGGKRDGGREGEEGGVVGEDLIFIEQALQIDSQHSAVISLQSELQHCTYPKTTTHYSYKEI